ncbi:hypothetical protein IID24_04950 [Patescibacteria group bacterium]|nr:hypothetical protein [Patescibacteria group bacterium]
MFPAKTVGIIGDHGKMAQSIYEPLFTEAGYQVIGSDSINPTGMSNDEVVRTADVVLFSILPLDNVAREIRAQIKNARPNTLWLHGSSVQQVRDDSIGDALLVQELKDRGVDIGFVHFMIAPTVKSLRGQAIVLGFPSELINPDWESWFENLLLSKKARVFHKTIDEHDELTKGAQLLPMLLAVATGMVWQREGVDVSEMLRVAGAPAKLQAFGTIRSLGQQDVVSEIITRHPAGPTLVRRLGEIFAELAEWIENKDVDKIASEIEQARERIDEDDLRKVLSTTDWLVRVLGDLNGGAVGLQFSGEQNQLGLLAEVLARFDKHGVDKTTTTAQRLPDGSAQFFVGVEPDLDDPSVRGARQEIVDELGAELIKDGFTI